MVYQKKKKRGQAIIVFAATLLAVLLSGFVVLLFINTLNGKSGESDNTGRYEVERVFLADLNPEEIADTNVSEDAESYYKTSKYADLLLDTRRCMEERIFPAETMEEGRVTMLFGGDICLDESYAHVFALQLRGGDISTVFSPDTLDIMHQSDIFMANLECTFTERGEPIPEKQYTIRAKPQMVKYLFDMGLDIVALGNNHCYDYGEISLLDTLDVLDSVGLPYVGAGRNFAHASKPVFFVAGDMKIGFINATQIEKLDRPDTPGAGENSPGTFRCWYDNRIVELASSVRNDCDYLVAYIHWGEELSDTPDSAQEELAAGLAGAGVDLIVGDHPHVLQRLDYISGVPVIYSVGNFWFNGKNRDTCLLQVEIDTEGKEKIRFIPATEPDSTTTIAHGEEAVRILDYMRSISPRVNIDENGYVTPGVR